MNDEEKLAELLDADPAGASLVGMREYAAIVARAYAQHIGERIVRAASEDGMTELAFDLGRVFESDPGTPAERREVDALLERLAEQSEA